MHDPTKEKLKGEEAHATLFIQLQNQNASCV